MTSQRMSRIWHRGSQGHASLPLAHARLTGQVPRQDEGEGEEEEEPQGLEVNLRVKVHQSLLQSIPQRWLQKYPNRFHQRMRQLVLLLLPHLPQMQQVV